MTTRRNFIQAGAALVAASVLPTLGCQVGRRFDPETRWKTVGDLSTKRHHYEVVYDRRFGQKVYIDGIEVTSTIPEGSVHRATLMYMRDDFAEFYKNHGSLIVSQESWGRIDDDGSLLINNYIVTLNQPPTNIP